MLLYISNVEPTTNVKYDVYHSDLDEAMYDIMESYWSTLYLDHSVGITHMFLDFFREWPEYLPGEIIIIQTDSYLKQNLERAVDALYYRDRGVL